MSIEDILEAREKEKLAQVTKDAAKSGGGYGGLIGLGTGLLSEKKSIANLLSKTIGGALGGAATSAGSTYLGSKLAGTPDEGEEGGYTNRGALGGSILGGLAGAGGGALVGSAGLRRLAARLGETGLGKKAAGLAKDALPSIDSYAGDFVKKMALKGKGPSAKALGLAGAAGGGFWGGGEGMQLDYYKTLDDEEEPYGPY